MLARDDLREGLASLSTALTEFGTAIKTAVGAVTDFNKKAVSAYYNVAGKHTFPLQQEVFNDGDEAGVTIPTVAELGPAQISLFIVPVIPIVFVSSFTWIPLIGNSIQSLVKGFVYVANLPLLDLPDEKRIQHISVMGTETGQDHRTVLRQIYGLPGLIMGAVFGGVSALAIAIARGVWNLLLDSARSFVEAYVTVANIGLVGREKKLEIITKHKERNMARRFTLGLPGLIVGAVFGGISALLIGAVRGVWQFLLDSTRSFVEAYVTVANLGLIGQEKKLEIITEHKNRNMARRFTLGVPGLIVGAVFGGISAIVIGIGRGLWKFLLDSVRSFVEAYVTVANLALVGRKNKLEIITEHKNRSMARRFTLGVPGLIVGAVFGGVSALLIGITRGIWNFLLDSVRSFVEAYVTVANLGLIGREKKLEITTKHKDRNMARRFTLGLPGLIVGAVLGGVSALLIGIARGTWKFLLDSARSFVEAYVTVANLALVGRKNKLEIITEHKERSNVRRFTLGLPGLIVGAVFGGISALVIGATRGLWNFLLDSARSFVESYVTVANLGLVGRENKLEIITKHKDRNMARRFTIGLPGLIVGAVFGGISTLLILTTRGLWNFLLDTVRSFVEAYVTVANLGLAGRDKKLEIITKHKDRNMARRFTIGLPGMILGAVFGGISAVLIGIGRGVWNWSLNTIRSLKQTYAMIVNFSLPEDKQIALPGIINEERSPIKKYLVGLLGIIIGGVAGFISAGSVFIGRGFWAFAKNTFLSWRALSGSFINGAVNRAWYEALRGDDRTAQNKVLGGLGYVIACVTSAPAALMIYIVRNIPLVLGAITAFLASSFILMGKALALAFSAPRFLPAEAVDLTIQKFKNLYSALTAFGDFELDKKVDDNATGNDSAKRFLWKCFKFNLNTPTEKLLNKILDAYRDYKRQGIAGDFFESSEFNAAIQEIKDRYQVNFMSTQEDMDVIHHKIDQAVQFIKDYMHDKTDRMQKLEENFTITAWTSTFFGKKKPSDAYIPIPSEEQLESHHSLVLQ